MAGVYVDTSALGRVLLAEPEAEAIRGLLAAHDAWWSSELLVVELRRLAAREGLEAEAEEYLDAFRLVSIDTASLQRASRLEPMVVRSLDAIHLEAALQLREGGQVDGVVTYDQQLSAGCTHHGLSVHAPVAK
jgi:predicted nucleic acid-binding protein